MLERAVRLSDPRLQSLRTLDGEGLLVHAVMHTSLHCFRTAFKLAWDVAQVLELFPTLDWKRVEKWVQHSSAPRAFWLPCDCCAKN
jgi:hypothetical protein